MRGQLLNIEDGKTVFGEDLRDGGEREIGIVLVIGRIELIVSRHLQQMRKFEGRDAARLEEGREAADEIVDVRHMRKHVVGGRKVCGAPCSTRLPASSRPKNASTISMPLALAALAVLAVGSTP